MKLVYQTNQQTNFALSGSSLSLACADAVIKEEEPYAGDSGAFMIEDDSSMDGETSSSSGGIGGYSSGYSGFEFARCESLESIGNSYRILTMEGFEESQEEGPAPGPPKRVESFDSSSDDELQSVEVAGRTGSRTKELFMSELGHRKSQSLLSLSNKLSSLGSSAQLYWAPDRRSSPLSVGLNTMWLFWGPLISNLNLSPNPLSTGAGRKKRCIELKLPESQQYLAGTTIACTSALDGQRLVEEVFEDEIYSKAQSIVENADFVVDIGSNVGAFASWVAAKHNAAGNKNKVTVLCLEPVPSTAAAFQQNASRAMMKHPNANIKLAKMGLAPTKKGSRSDVDEVKSTIKLTYFEETPSSSTTHPQYKYESSIKPLLQSDEAFLDYYKSSKPSLCSMIQSIPFQGLRKSVCELAVAFLWRWRPVSVNLGSLLEAFHMTKTELPETIDLLKVDIGVAMDFIEDWWWPKVRNVLIEEVASSTDAHRQQVLSFLRKKGFELEHEKEGRADDAGVVTSRYMILRNKNSGRK